MRIIFMGTPSFSVPIAQKLLDMGHTIVAVFTQPPKPAKRGKILVSSPMHQWAIGNGIAVHTPASFRKEPDAVATFLTYGADLAVVAAYGLLLPEALLSAPTWGCVNVHASLLPRWRGASPVHMAILNGDTHTGITLMRMDAGLDTGPMLAQKSLPIDAHETTATLYDKLCVLSCSMVEKYLDAYFHHQLPSTVQPTDGVCFAPLLKKSDGLLDFTHDAVVLERQIRAFTPWPTSYFLYEGVPIRVLSATVEGYSLGDDSPAQSAGTILDDNLLIACGRNALRPLVLQRAGRNPMNTADFLRGFPVPLSSCLLP